VSVGKLAFFELGKPPSSENGGGASEIGRGSGSFSIFTAGGVDTVGGETTLKTLRSGTPL